MPLEAKAVAFAALASDAAAAQRQQPQHVTVVDARQVLYSAQRATEKHVPGTDEKQQIPDRVTFAVPPDVVRSMRSEPKDAKQVMLLLIVPADAVREIARRAESKIVTPDQDRAERAARLVRP